MQSFLTRQHKSSPPRPVLESRSEALRKVFAANLRRCMHERGLSQSDLARAIWQENRTDAKGYEQPMGKDRISAYYRGTVMPTSTNLNKIAEKLGVDPEAMLTANYDAAVETAVAAAQKPDIMLFQIDGADPSIVLVELKMTLSRDTANEIMAIIAKGSPKRA